MSNLVKIVLLVLLAVILIPLAFKIVVSLLAWTFKLAILALIVIGAMTVISRLLRHA
jgi:hypothetical protein